MKKSLIAIVLIGILCVLSNNAYAYPSAITVDSLINGSLGNDYTAGIREFFSAGNITISVDGGAWNAWGKWGDTYAGYLWNMNIYQEATQTMYSLGKLTAYGSPTEALNANLGASITINQSTDGYLWFYIKDSYVPDNVGAITASIVDPPSNGSTSVPEPSTMLLLGAGLVGLVGFRKKLRAKLEDSDWEVHKSIPFRTRIRVAPLGVSLE